MTRSKRVFDIALALCGLAIFAVPLVAVAALLMIGQGRPIFYRSERMVTPDRAFLLWKFRTMQNSKTHGGVTGGDKIGRITPIGLWLRRLKLDELPQLWNILHGDMSFIGPRPPLRAYVERFPDLYAKVLRSRPGLSGLATVVFYRHEAALLAVCKTVQDTDAIYARRCIPRKAHLDLIYQARQSLWLDLVLLWKTFSCVFSDS